MNKCIFYGYKIIMLMSILSHSKLELHDHNQMNVGDVNSVAFENVRITIFPLTSYGLFLYGGIPPLRGCPCNTSLLKDGRVPPYNWNRATLPPFFKI